MKFTPTILFGVITVVVAIIAVVVVSLKNKEGFGQNYNERICEQYPIRQGPLGGQTKYSCENYLSMHGCGPTVHGSTLSTTSEGQTSAVNCDTLRENY